MPSYVVLATFTERGAHDVKDTISRSDKFKAMAKDGGVTVKDMYWLMGAYDVLALCEAPDDETAVALSISTAARGFVQTQTLRAFTAEEVGRILEKMV